MSNKIATIKIEKNKEGETNVFLDGMELETVERVSFDFHKLQKPYISISLEVPSVNIEAAIEDIQLNTSAYRRCAECGKWIIPSIAKNLAEKTVTAEYECTLCKWTDSIEIQNWNDGIQEVKPVTNMADEEEDIPRDAIAEAIKNV